MLVNKHWPLHIQKQAEQNQEINFADQKLPMDTFAKKLLLFDAFEINNDSQGTALITNLPVYGESFQLLLLNNHFTTFNQSNIIDFKTYISLMCKTRFIIPSRFRLFGKEPPKTPIPIYNSTFKNKNLTPALFK
jgi:hypothetical protein